MTLSQILVTLSGVLAIISVLPYLLDVIKGSTKPRVVTWLVWSTLTYISAAAAFSEHQYLTTIYLACSGTATLSIAILGFKYGNKKITKLDIYCFIGAVIGLLFWWLFNSASTAVIIMVLVDFIGAIPTVVHCWNRPQEETISNYVIGCIGGCCLLLSISNWTITSSVFAIYILIMNMMFASEIFFRKKILNKDDKSK